MAASPVFSLQGPSPLPAWGRVTQNTMGPSKGREWRTHMVPCQPEDRVPFLIGLLRGLSFKTFLPREDKFFMICPKHHIYWHESVLPGGHHVATETESVHGRESCVLEGPGGRKDLSLAEEAPSATRQGTGDGRGPSCRKMIWDLIQKVLTPSQSPCPSCPSSLCGSEASTVCSSRPLHTRLMSPVPPRPATENQGAKVDSCTPVY